MKLGSDIIGVAKGLLTIPMALLSVVATAAGLVLAVREDWRPILYGIVAFLVCSVLARLLERLVVAIDDIAAVSLDRQRRRRARIAAAVSGALPVAILFTTEILCLRGVMGAGDGSPAILHWLWGYGVATGPWTFFAARVSRFRRTLVAIRAYAGHIALWLFSLLTFWLHASPAIVGIVLVLPSILPFTVGLLLALADREAIANVRV